MTTLAKVTHPHIVKEPEYCGGKAALANTRVRVMNVVFLHKRGKTEAEILETYPDLNRAQVYAALAYYYDHKDEIETELREADEFVQQVASRYAPHLLAK